MQVQENDISSLSWFSYPGLMVIGSPVSYSFLHSLFAAFYKPYMMGKVGEIPLNRQTFISSLFSFLGLEEQTWPEKLSLNIFIFDADEEKIRLFQESFQFDRQNVLLHKRGSIYQTVAVNVAPSSTYPILRTVFSSNDDLIQKLLNS